MNNGGKWVPEIVLNKQYPRDFGNGGFEVPVGKRLLVMSIATDEMIDLDAWLNTSEGEKGWPLEKSDARRTTHIQGGFLFNAGEKVTFQSDQIPVDPLKPFVYYWTGILYKQVP